jgi:hypothetical protein
LRVLLHLFLLGNFINFYSGLAEEVEDEVGVLVVGEVDHLPNPGGDDVLTAVDAGKVGHKDGGSLDGGAPPGRVGDGVLLRMDGVLLMAVEDDAPVLAP